MADDGGSANDSNRMAVALAELRGEVLTGFTRLEGQINLLVHTSDDNRRDLNDLGDRVSALEAKKYPAGMPAALSVIISAAGVAVAYFVR